MKKQYCKVGTVTPMTDGRYSISTLEYLYESFVDKATNIKYTGTKLGEFFEQKANKLKKELENLI
ncbi:MAG: hypothetical protein V3U92_18460 [Cellulophaga sp.]